MNGRKSEYFEAIDEKREVLGGTVLMDGDILEESFPMSLESGCCEPMSNTIHEGGTMLDERLDTKTEAGQKHEKRTKKT